jgi:hypothetical protein
VRAAAAAAAAGGTAPVLTDAEARGAVAASSCPFGSVVERYYTKYFAAGVGGRRGNDQVAYWHTNGTVVVALAPRHEIIVRSLRVARVEFSTRGEEATLAGRAAAAAGAKGRKSMSVLEPDSA